MASRAFATSAAGDCWMPSEIPVSISGRVPPSSRASGSSARIAAMTHMPISTAAFAIR
jgi:hypothetical protein